MNANGFNKMQFKTTIMIEYIQAKAYLDKKKKAKERKLRLFSVIHRFLCKVGLHKWKYERGVINKYYECKCCKRRKVVESGFLWGKVWICFFCKSEWAICSVA